MFHQTIEHVKRVVESMSKEIDEEIHWNVESIINIVSAIMIRIDRKFTH